MVMPRDLIRSLSGRMSHQALDLGTHNADPVDYPDYAEAVGIALLEGGAKWKIGPIIS